MRTIRTTRTMRTTRPARIAGALGALCLAGSFSILPACGGDDDTGAAGETDFCSLVIQTFFAGHAASATADDEFDAVLYRALGDLADRAPTEELRAAMGAFADYADKVTALDPDDPDDMWEYIDLLGEESFMDANDTVSTYLEEVCEFSNAAD